MSFKVSDFRYNPSFWKYVSLIIQPEYIPTEEYMYNFNNSDFSILPWYKSKDISAWYVNIVEYLKIANWTEWVSNNILDPDKMVRSNQITLMVKQKIAMSMLEKIEMPTSTYSDKELRLFLEMRLKAIVKSRYDTFNQYYVDMFLRSTGNDLPF